MPDPSQTIAPRSKGGSVSVIQLTRYTVFSFIEMPCAGISADILGLKFLPVRSEGPQTLQSLGDLA